MTEAKASDDEFNAFVADYEERREALFEMVAEFADEHELDSDMLAELLLDLTLSFRMMAYADSVEKPSVQGLKADFDRFRKHVDEHVRELKKGAEDFIAEVKAERLAETQGAPGEEK